MGNIIRPRVDEDFVLRIKMKYPKETAILSAEKTVAWALERFLDVETIGVDP